MTIEDFVNFAGGVLMLSIAFIVIVAAIVLVYALMGSRKR